MAAKRYFVISLLISFLISVCCLLEPGKKELHFKGNQTFDCFTKTMNKGYSVAIKGNCKGAEKVIINWRLDVSQCAESFSFLKASDQMKLRYLWDDFGPDFSAYSLHGELEEVSCNAMFHLKDLTDKVQELIIQTATEKPTADGGTTDPDVQELLSDEASRLSGKPEKKTTPDKENVDNRVCVTKRDGVFLLIVKAEPSIKDKDKDFELTLIVEMKGQHGYLSASEWPLYLFYGYLSLLYVFYGIVWLIVSACQWRDLLRIQFWIGGVIALGMLEKAVFFSEYNNVNITGETNPTLTVFAELVSCVMRTLFRILVILASIGFGVVKPQLGTTLHRVLGVGALYFLLATIEGCFRSLDPKFDLGRQQLIASIPLAILNVSICWWIFRSLVQTKRTLRIRSNLVKLSLYRRFTNTLIFAVLASVAYMIWSIKTRRFAKDGCITEWSELWLDDAFWHFLFSIVLLVIMVLWRPTANNQRYVLTPIVDFGDDDDDNMTLSDAFDGMKMGNVKNTPEVIISGDTKHKHKPEDDLK